MAPDAPRLDTPARMFFTQRRRPGISFTERMSGRWGPSDAWPAASCPVPWTLNRVDYERAAADDETRIAGGTVELVLTIVAEELEAMLHEPHHQAGFTGTARIQLARGEAPMALRVTNGVFRLFVAGPKTDIISRMMEYRGRLTGEHWEGDFEGFKALRFGGGHQGFGGDESYRALWRDQTRLFFGLNRVTEHGRACVGLGILELTAGDVMRQLGTIRARGTKTVAETADTLARFGYFYGGVLRDTYGGPLARSRYAPPNWWARPQRLLTDGPNGQALGRDCRPLTTRDGAAIAVTRYGSLRAHGNGPVLLAPGFGVNPTSFAIDTVPVSLVEFLRAEGYDPWLFDYRASPAASATPGNFTLDDIAVHDWPLAVRHVSDAYDGRPIHVIAHCVGSLTLLMAALSRDLQPDGVPPLRGRIAQAICSQVGLHPVSNELNALKAMASLGVWMEYVFGRRAIRLTMHAGQAFGGKLWDRLLKLYPAEEPCDNPVCRRIRFVFGESYRHANLNARTHDAMIEMFGDRVRRGSSYVSVQALRHLLRIVRNRGAQDRDGHDIYLPNTGDIDFPVRFIHGTRNTLFPLAGLEETCRWLHDRGTRVDLTPIAGYGHMDCFIGRNAAHDVFKAVLLPLLQTPLAERPAARSPGLTVGRS
jgi:cholesterol oxidase